LVLNALVAMGALRKAAGRFENTGTGRQYLVKSSPDFVGHLLSLQDAEWVHWGQLEQVVRTGSSPVKRHLFETDPERGARVLAVLDRIGRQSGPEFARRLHLEEARTVLDLGGGAGTNAIAFTRCYPGLRATVFDLPQTLRVTKRTVAAAGADDRVTLAAGDFNQDPLGGPYDVILMSDILHYQNADANAALVSKAYAHLNSNGRLIIKDRFLDESRTSPAWATAFAVHIMVNTEQGRCYTVDEAVRWMKDAGFTGVTELERTAVVQGMKSS
jgi:predicted O-methyltransferase YrrM